MNVVTRTFHRLVRVHQAEGICKSCAMLLAVCRAEAAAGVAVTDGEFLVPAPFKFHPRCESAAANRGWRQHAS